MLKGPVQGSRHYEGSLQKKRERIVKKLQKDKVNQVENLYRGLVGADEDSLLEEMEEAERQWEEAKREHPEEAVKLEQEAEFDFEQLMARIHEEEKKPVSQKQYNRQKKWENEEVKNQRRGYKKFIALAAALGILLIGGGINTIAKSGYRYMIYPEQKSENAGLRYNTKIKFIQDDLEEAYQEISECFEIPVLKLDYMPDELEFQGISKAERYIILRFDYKGKYLYLREEKLIKGKATGLIISDRNDGEKIKNEWIDEELQLEENKLESGDIEYSVALENEEVYYYLCGIMEKKEFVKIAENLMY